MVGERVVDGIDVGIGEQGFVTAMRPGLAGQAKLGNVGLGLVRIARSDGDDFAERRFHDRRRDLLEPDIGGGEDTPPDFAICHDALLLARPLVASGQGSLP